MPDALLSLLNRGITVGGRLADSANAKFTITQSASDASSLSHRAGLINSTNPLFGGFTGIEPVRSFHHGQARTYENPIEFGDRYVGQTLWPLRGQRAINAGKTELTFSSTFV